MFDFDIEAIKDADGNLVFNYPFCYQLLAFDRGFAEKTVIDWLKQNCGDFDPDNLKFSYEEGNLYDEKLGLIWENFDSIMNIYYEDEEITGFFKNFGTDFGNPLELPELNLDKLTGGEIPETNLDLIRKLIKEKGDFILWSQFRDEE